MIAVQLVAQPGGSLIMDLTPHIESASLGRGPHGESDLALSLRLPNLGQQLALVARDGTPWVEVVGAGDLIWAGRVEDAEASSDGLLTLTAYGPWRALEDARDTALWSDTRTDGWRAVAEGEPAYAGLTLAPAKFDTATDGRLWITLPKGATFLNLDTTAHIYDTPAGSSRAITAIAFDYAVTLPAGWFAFIIAAERDNTSPATLWLLAGAGGLQGGSLLLPLAAARPRLIVGIQAAAGTPAGETGTWYARLTNIRVTTNLFAVDTTLAAGALAGATSISVASGAGFVVGMTLYLSGTTPERVTVTSVAGTSIGITALLLPKSAGATVRAQRVTAADIAAHLAGVVSALNPAMLAGGAALIQPTAADLVDVSYVGASPADVLDGLAAQESLSVGVSRERLLWLRSRDDPAWNQTYAVDAADITVGVSIEALRNQITATYRDASGRTRTTAAATDAQSVARWGLTRQAGLETDTTSQAEAERLRDLARADAAHPPPRLSLRITRLYAPSGAVAPLTALAPGDTLLIRNLPLGADGDAATGRVARTEYDAVTGALAVEFEEPPDSLETALAAPQGRTLGPSPLQEALYALGRRYRPDLFR